MGRFQVKYVFYFISTMFMTSVMLQIYFAQNPRKFTCARKITNWRNLSQKQQAKLSTLGRILYLDEDPPLINEADGKVYKILVWKYGSMIEKRHLKQFSNERVDPFRNCLVKNCEITFNESDLDKSDIVIFHLHRMKGLQDVPKRSNSGQLWAFLTDESPYHTFLSNKNNKLSLYNGIFNWSMTYRMDSDIPVPYGRTMLGGSHNDIDRILKGKRKDILIAIMGSNCKGKNNRWKYVAELQKHIKVDTYGKCGKIKTCPGHFESDCPILENYLFYMAFENSNCDEYLTEKLWWNAFHKNSIPIVMGAKVQDYKNFLPPNSYINVDDFANPADLARYIYHLNRTEGFHSFYEWKNRFHIVNEHGYFQSESFHFCRVCEALNFNSREKKVYQRLEDFWSVNKNCYPAWNS